LPTLPAASAPEAQASAELPPLVARTTPPSARRPAREVRRRVAVQSASARCEGRNFFSRLICLKHECERDARLRSDPVCVKMRREEDERRQALVNH
jgi:hypothetical protein